MFSSCLLPSEEKHCGWMLYQEGSEAVTKLGKNACSEYLKRDNLHLQCIFANYSGPSVQNLLVVAFVQEKTIHLNITS